MITWKQAKEKAAEQSSDTLEIEQIALEIWEIALREEYSQLNDRLYIVCYSEAYDRGHSGGHDEVASYMIDVYEFVRKVLKAV